MTVLLRILHYAALAAFLAFALFPLFWLLKVSVTPDDLLYSEGVRPWPSRMTLDNYLSVLRHTQFPLYFRNSLIVSSATALFSTAAASAAGYGFSRFRYPGKSWVAGLLLVSQMFPLVIIVAPIFRILAPLGLTNSLAGLVVVYTALNTPFAKEAIANGQKMGSFVYYVGDQIAGDRGWVAMDDDDDEEIR